MAVKRMSSPAKPGMSAEERFLIRAGPPDGNGCINWEGSLVSRGYGYMRLEGRLTPVHRYAYERERGPIPVGLTIDHLCRNKACVNPAHLEPVPIGVNVVRAPSAAGLNARKTACPQGHPYDLINTRYTREGNRSCRICVTIRSQAKRTGRTNKGQRNGRAKLTDREAAGIKALATSELTHAAIARQYGVSRTTVTDILSGATWRHL